MRTSTGTFFGLGEHQVLRDIESRISAVTHLPAINGEGIQVPIFMPQASKQTVSCVAVLLHLSNKTGGFTSESVQDLYLVCVHGMQGRLVMELRIGAWAHCAQQHLCTFLHHAFRAVVAVYRLL